MSHKRKNDEMNGEVSKDFALQKIDGCIEENGVSNHTDDYESDALFIRRGQTFNLKLVADDASNINLDLLSIHLETGKRPSRRSGTLIKINKKNDEEFDEWFYTVSGQTDTTIGLVVNVPAETLVSKYKLKVQAMKIVEAKKSEVELEYEKDVYILFNPWCKDDDVYMESEELKDEYVLNDIGAVYWGGLDAKRWFFGQFTDAAVRCTFKLLEKNHARRRDTAREVVRHMSAVANSIDNNGLLEGNWSGDYSGGEKPWQWTGSVKIFKKYLEIKKPVKYGQCWVFSGLLTSMMRTLGIPCRSVTNYSSAHDTDNNCTFDMYFDENMDYLEDYSDDSCWNFHVWNDVWMARPDLAAGMGGWQAVDGTPQEESRGIHRCGPAPLQAIKEGNINYNYDTRFVFAEVNADKVYWQRNNEKGYEDWEAVRVAKNAVGRNISTKKPNSWWREDITKEYKHIEGSLLERAAVRNALKKSKNPVIEKQESVVKFRSKLSEEGDFEKGVELTIFANNTVSEKHTVSVAVSAQVIRYTGVTLRKLGTKKLFQEIEGKQAHEFKFQYKPDEFIEELDENIGIRLSYMAKVDNTRVVYVSQKVSMIKKPDLEISLVDPSKAKVNPDDTVKVKITVPKVGFFKKYTNCVLNIDGSIVADDSSHSIDDINLEKDNIIEHSFNVKKNLKKSKVYELVISFDSKELTGLTGTLDFQAEA